MDEKRQTEVRGLVGKISRYRINEITVNFNKIIRRWFTLFVIGRHQVANDNQSNSRMLFSIRAYFVKCH